MDDEVNTLGSFQRVLSNAGYEVALASSGEEALQRLGTEWFDLIISDLKLPGLDGLDLLRQVKTLNPTLPVILLTAYGSVATAVEAMKEGAYDFLSKPINNEELKLVAKKALDLPRLTREMEHLRAQGEIEEDFKDVIGHSKPMKALFRLIKLVAPSTTTLLIQGESGTGKELIARAVQQLSPRRDRPFVAIDCGALPETLLESELFGYVRGAFTGAVLNKKGLFCEAPGGTLLLDEIGDTTPAFQAKLLRVLQEREIRLLGSNRSINVDVRVIAATSKDLKKAVAKGTFREDLYSTGWP
jgi:DNA-binding NtrC family response regulator